MRAQRTHQLGASRGGRRIVGQPGNRFAQYQFRRRVIQNERQSVVRIGRVDRQIHRSGFENPQRGDDQFRRLVQQDRHAVLGTYFLADQPMRQPV